MGTRVACLLGERLIEAQERLADLARKEVPERLASQILRLVGSEGNVTRDGYRIPTRYTHRHLATMIGANREARHQGFREAAIRWGRGAEEPSDPGHRL